MCYDANSRTCLGDVISVFTQGIDRESKAPPNIRSFLRGCSSLKSVHLAGISSLNMEVILELLSRGLQELHLIGCDVKSLEAFSIFGSLLPNTTLNVLDLSCNDDIFVGEDCENLMCCVVGFLRLNKTIEAVCLRGQSKPFNPLFSLAR